MSCDGRDRQVRLRPRSFCGSVLDIAPLPDHIDRLYRAAYVLCGSRQDAEDLVEATYARTLRRPGAVGRGEDLAHLLRGLRNAYDTKPWKTPPHEGPAVFGAVSELPPRLRDAIVAVDVAGLSPQEAGRSLRIRSATLTRRLQQARRDVAQAVETRRSPDAANPSHPASNVS